MVKREAIVSSIKQFAVKYWVRKELIVPKIAEPVLVFSLRESDLFMRCANFGPPKWALRGEPVILNIVSERSFNFFTISIARPSCQLSAGVKGFNVLSSQNKKVDRWSAIPET